MTRKDNRDDKKKEDRSGQPKDQSERREEEHKG